MKVKLAFLVQNEALQKLVEEPMDALTSFRIGKTVLSVQSELETFEKTRQSMLEKYGTKNGRIASKPNSLRKIRNFDQLNISFNL